MTTLLHALVVVASVPIGAILALALDYVIKRSGAKREL